MHICIFVCLCIFYSFIYRYMYIYLHLYIFLTPRVRYLLRAAGPARMLEAPLQSADPPG